MKRLLNYVLVACCIVMGAATANAQTRINVSGTVVDPNGAPVVGVVVLQDGTNNAAISDAEGRFNIAVPDDALLKFSCMGHESQDIAVEGRTSIAVTLSLDAQVLDGVVVTGYGTASSKDVSGSIASLSSDELNHGSATSINQMLQGRAAGVMISNDGDPNGAGSITIRGTSTLREGGMSPLYVVDGVPMQGTATPAPQDIVSIDILKDASAAAIYGSRAANGVILITTRQGQNGESKYLTFDSYVNIETVANRYEMMNAEQYREYVADGGKTLDPMWEDNVDTDWQREVMRTAISQNHYLNLGGASGGTKYDASVNFLSRNGIIKTTGQEKITARASLDQTLLDDRLSIGMTLNGSIANRDMLGNPSSLYTGMLQFVPNVTAYNPDGTFRQDYANRPVNPITLLEQLNSDARNEMLFGSLRAKATLFEGLDYNLSLSYQTLRNLNNSYIEKDFIPDLYGNGEATRSTSTSSSLVFENYFSYKLQVDRHGMNAMLGYSWQEDTTGDGFQTTNENFISDATGYYNMGLGSTPAGYLVDYGRYSIKALRMISFYGRVNYNFDQRYIIQASLRRDGSSAFGANSRWGYFPSVSGAWRIISESFMENQNLFDDLKFKVGWGISGNTQGFDPMIARLRYGKVGSFYYNGVFMNGIGPVQNENPNLKWEKTSMVNLGVDMAFFDSRLIVGVEYYNKLTSDLIADYDVPVTEYLYGTMTANVGKIRNDGVEVTITATPVKTGKFGWNTTLTLAHNRNKVVSLSNDLFARDDFRGGPAGAGQSGTNSMIIKEGYPLGSFFLLRFAGFDDEGHSLFIGKDGSLVTSPTFPDDQVIMGSTQPKLNFGWSHNFTYGNWSLGLMFNGVLGHNVLNATLASLNTPWDATYTNLPTYTLESGQPGNDTNAHFISDRYVESADFIRLQNASLAYDFKFKPESGVKALSVYANVNNAFVITKYKGIDPDVNMGGRFPGVDDRNFYPMSRAFQLGAKLTF
ncbi:MAG: SusC/RagA family TonB-linked outer membrane protein [Alistipes sp.]|jgi:iron complex outermembrane receptor protein|nr:SusC/RagA family TonB-linked outer membrane protein [Alistipes sp.]